MSGSTASAATGGGSHGVNITLQGNSVSAQGVMWLLNELQSALGMHGKQLTISHVNGGLSMKRKEKEQLLAVIADAEINAAMVNRPLVGLMGSGAMSREHLLGIIDTIEAERQTAPDPLGRPYFRRIDPSLFCAFPRHGRHWGQRGAHAGPG